MPYNKKACMLVSKCKATGFVILAYPNSKENICQKLVSKENDTNLMCVNITAVSNA